MLASEVAGSGAGNIRRFYVWDVDVIEALEEDDTLGPHRSESNRSRLALLEGAFQDAYKAIEASFG